MHLLELGQGVFAIASATPEFGSSNVGLVIDADGLTVIDTAATPANGQAVRSEILTLTAELELPIKRVVLTSSRVPFAGGSKAFWQASFIGSESTSDQLDAPVNTEALRRLLPNLAPAFDEEFATRPVTHTIDVPTWLTPAAQGLVFPGESPGNLVVQVPNAGVVFAGALASFGVTPLAFDGDPAAWASSLEEMITLETTIIPGHGPAGGAADVADLVAYLRACVDVDGDASALPSGPWDSWTNRQFDAVNVERAARLARGDTATPHAMFELLGLA